MPPTLARRHRGRPRRDRRHCGAVPDRGRGRRHDCKADVVCVGHTHRGFDRTTGGLRVINVGSVKQSPKRIAYAVAELPTRSSKVIATTTKPICSACPMTLKRLWRPSGPASSFPTRIGSSQSSVHRESERCSGTSLGAAATRGATTTYCDVVPKNQRRSRSSASTTCATRMRRCCWSQARGSSTWPRGSAIEKTRWWKPYVRVTVSMRSSAVARVRLFLGGEADAAVVRPVEAKGGMCHFGNERVGGSFSYLVPASWSVCAT